MKLLLLSVASNLSLLAAAAAPFQNRLVFGVIFQNTQAESRRPCFNSVFSLRGGEVHESDSLDDLESLIQTAALNDQLTVIDFTAT